MCVAGYPAQHRMPEADRRSAIRAARRNRRCPGPARFRDFPACRDDWSEIIPAESPSGNENQGPEAGEPLYCNALQDMSLPQEQRQQPEKHWQNVGNSIRVLARRGVKLP